MVSKGDMSVIAAVVLLAGGAYVAAITMDPTTQKTALLGSGIGAGLIIAGHL